MVKTQVFQSIKTREDWRLSQAYRRYTYTYKTVKFQRRSSINVQQILTVGSLYNRFRIERVPQNGVFG